MHRFVIPVLFLAALAAIPAAAQDASDGTLHVVRPVIHAEQDEAELCLEFDHDLDARGRDRLASALKLTSDGEAIQVGPQNISIASDTLCVSSLEHRRDYHVIVGTGLHGAQGEKLAGPYGLAFTVPDRKPTLGFAGDDVSEGFVRWQDSDPVLRSINVPKVHLSLYRIADPAMLAVAWRDRQQTTLAPSESATFGHDHGQLVWSGDVPLEEKPNATLERTIQLHDWAGNDLPHGLYLLIARAPETKKDKETEIGATSFATTGAIWLLHSDLSLHALRGADGFYGLVEKKDSANKTGAVAKDARLIAADANAVTLAETRSDNDGVGFIPLSGDRMGKAAVLIGLTDAGDVNFAGLSQSPYSRADAPPNRISVTTDRPFYLPTAPVSVSLVARDAQGRAIPASGTLALEWPESQTGGTYTSLPVPPAADGAAHLSFVAPAKTGIWSLVWHQDNGAVLAKVPLRVTTDAHAQHIEMSADRVAVSHDGDVNLTLKSLDADGKPVAYHAGQVLVAWTAPDIFSKGWNDYRFGTGAAVTGNAVPQTSFVTDEKGTVSLHLALTSPDDHAPLHSAVISIADEAPPSPLILPVKPKENVIGIKPMAVDARFPENGLARFAVVALDGDGHRRDAGDLTYQIYEEGRSFDWYQAEGRWNYRPQQQKRRIGGGELSLSATGDDIIEWPVAAGTYRLEITDTNGALRAATVFSAGSGLPAAAPAPAPLPLFSSVAAWRAGQDIALRFKLDRPSIVTSFISDDRIRKLVHHAMPPGENTVTFTPEKEWGDHLTVDVEAEDLNLAGRVELPRASDTAVATSKEIPSAPGEPLTITGLVPPVIGVDDVASLSFDIVNNGKTAEKWHYAWTTGPGLKVSDVAARAITVPPGQSVKTPLTLTALHAGASSLRIDVTGPAHFHAARDWEIAVEAENGHLDSAIRARIEPQQSTSWPPGDKGRAKDDSILLLSAAPLYGGPSLLSDMLDARPFATGDIAGMLEVFRLWRGMIAESGLMPDSDIARRQHDLLLRLLSRQESDGGFTSLPGSGSENPSDRDDTAKALVALIHSNEAFVKPAADQAAQWLRQNLENTWFDERERPERAAAYAALAEAGRLDNASLHYFSDTSAQKSLPPLAAAQLAYAFATLGDRSASAFWIDRSGVAKIPAPLPPEILPVLAENGFYDFQNLLPSFEALLGGKDRAMGMEAAASVLRALSFIEDRKGAWRVAINTDKRNLKNVLVVSVPAKTIVPVIHNTGDGAIFLAGLQKADGQPAAPNGITRHIYQLNGTEVGGHKPLARDTTYLVVLEGAWPVKNTGALLLHDNLGPALAVAGCLPPAPIEAADSLAWLKSQLLTEATACETSGDGIDMALTRKSPGKDNHSGWRVAYLAKAEGAGAFTLQSASAQPLSEGLAAFAATPRDRIDIR